MSKKKKKNRVLDLLKATRTREWLIKPVTQVVPNAKAKLNKKACRGKTGEE